jgi:hypothetical protein
MKLILSTIAVAAALAATPASAQYLYVNDGYAPAGYATAGYVSAGYATAGYVAAPVYNNAYAYAPAYAGYGYSGNLTGQYQCVQMCSSGMPYRLAYVTQSGRELNVVDDLGMASRAWIENPGRMWVERANQGAVFSADGMTIQFDRGTIWQRVVDVGVVDYYPTYRRRVHRHR